ncbi:SixA phosphatase family protein [Mycolicibacterium fluoranthenivorans]|uniref:Phosphohistidine phosphatase n=1 Tax=Mycolicibacterium fluoranthenivorans TaxID=258505 RepID=A0A1G4X1C0_9MYCO|nr:histidine phosphatase family protein [Mycolicibacterium fluoranthenivorans]SCX33039.1 phosphohistidine phosphatase [Mycolicibacterium fluoranthenivorans]
MRTLILLRHGKSDYPTGVSDHDRPLAPRGIRESALAGDWLRAHAPRIDAVLCSTATRTRQTLARTGIDAPVTFVDRLYDSSPGIVLAEINEVAEDIGTLLVVGHEPVLSALALGLAGQASSAEAVETIEQKFPTSAIAVLQVQTPWSALELGSAQLVTVHVPR